MKEWLEEESGGARTNSQNGFLRSWTLTADGAISSHTLSHTRRWLSHTLCWREVAHFRFPPPKFELKCISVSHRHSYFLHSKLWTHTREIPQQSAHSVSLWLTCTHCLPHNLTRISHLLMTVTNAYWLHWVTYILSRSHLLNTFTQTLSPTRDESADCFHMTVCD